MKIISIFLVLVIILWISLFQDKALSRTEENRTIETITTNNNITIDNEEPILKVIPIEENISEENIPNIELKEEVLLINNRDFEENMTTEYIAEILEEQEEMVETMMEEETLEENDLERDESIRLKMIDEQERMLEEYGLE